VRGFRDEVEWLYTKLERGFGLWGQRDWDVSRTFTLFTQILPRVAAQISTAKFGENVASSNFLGNGQSKTINSV
jgi:hypothetical protein